MPQNLDWLSKDWDGIKAKAKEKNKSLIDFNDPKPKTDMEQTMNIDKIPFSRLQIGQDVQKDEPLEVTDLLVPPPLITETLEDMTENNDREGLMEAERKLQREEEENKMYIQISVGPFSDKEDSDTDTDDTAYTYFR